MTIIADIGAVALYLLVAWLASAMAAGYLSGRKGYGEKAGVATGLLLSAIGIIVWLIVPAREGSTWKHYGMFGSAKRTMESEETDSERAGAARA